MFFRATHMTLNADTPKEILEKAVNLRNSMRLIFLALYHVKKPSSAPEIAVTVGHNRAYVNMRLNQLEDMKLIKSSLKGKIKYFEVI